MYLMVASQQDKAGMNIGKIVAEKFGFKECGSFDGMPCYEKSGNKLVFAKTDILSVDYLDTSFSPECYLFLSKHKSEAGIPCLTVHSAGNFSNDDSYGGKKRELSLTHASMVKNALDCLKRFNTNSKYSVSLEVTHHGPTSLKHPLICVEVGSKEENWEDLSACGVVARAAFEISENSKTFRSAIGFGGPHYAPKFTDYCLKNEIGIGHICPKYHIAELDESMAKQMVEKTIPRPEIALIDWKGLDMNGRAKVTIILNKLKINAVKI